MIFDTIVAKTTAGGISAINVVRVSGDEAFPIVNAVFKGANLMEAKSHTIKYGYIHDGEEIIDEVIDLDPQEDANELSQQQDFNILCQCPYAKKAISY